MSSSELDLKKTKNFLRYKRLKSLNKAVLPIVSHIGSLTTIFVAYFSQSGVFSLTLNGLLDWLMIISLMILLIFGNILLLDRLSTKESIVITRAQASGLIALARQDATRSITNFSGDLSWLEGDLNDLMQLKKGNKGIDINIYFDSTKCTNTLLENMFSLSKVGIRFSPYPNSELSNLRVIWIDREQREDSKIFHIHKMLDKKNVDPRDSGLRIWRSRGQNSKFSVETLEFIAESIERGDEKPFLVGIIGLNNVGKTTFARKLKDNLEDIIKTEIVKDSFLLSSGKPLQIDNKVVLTQQAFQMNSKGNKVIIFDQTIIDTICYQMIQSDPGSLKQLVARNTSLFNLIIHIEKLNDNYSPKPGNLSIVDREKFGTTLKSFLKDNHIETKKVVIDGDEFHASLSDEAANIAKEIFWLYQRRYSNRNGPTKEQ